MTIPKSIRFEIFKRDNFTCRYCGGKPPRVILEIDHIVPKAEGGVDDPENLITSCIECNRGKERHLLKRKKFDELTRKQIDIEKERLEQVRALEEWLREKDKYFLEVFDKLADYWQKVLGFDRIELERQRAGIKNCAKKLNSEELLDAMHVLGTKLDQFSGSLDAIRYFYGICRNKIKGSTMEKEKPHISKEQKEFGDAVWFQSFLEDNGIDETTAKKATDALDTAFQLDKMNDELEDYLISDGEDAVESLRDWFATFDINLILFDRNKIMSEGFSFEPINQLFVEIFNHEIPFFYFRARHPARLIFRGCDNIRAFSEGIRKNEYAQKFFEKMQERYGLHPRCLSFCLYHGTKTELIYECKRHGMPIDEQKIDRLLKYYSREDLLEPFFMWHYKEREEAGEAETDYSWDNYLYYLAQACDPMFDYIIRESSTTDFNTIFSGTTKPFKAYLFTEEGILDFLNFSSWKDFENWRKTIKE